MQEFLTKTTVFLLIFHIPIVLMEIVLRQPAKDEFAAKVTFLEENLDNCEVLLLGSSHSHTGINPEWMDRKSVNVANYAQPFYYDYQILDTYAAKMPRLKAVVLPLSYPSFYTMPSKRHENMYSIHWDLKPYSREKNLENYSLILAEGFGNALKRMSDGENFFTHFGWHESSQEYDGGRAGAQLKLDDWHRQIEKGNIEDCILWLHRIQDLAHQMDICLILYYPPFTSYLNELLRDDPYQKQIQEAIRQLREDHRIQVIDTNDNEVFAPDMFRDPDHVNSKGARVLTGLINKQVKSCLNP